MKPTTTLVTPVATATRVTPRKTTCSYFSPTFVARSLPRPAIVNRSARTYASTATTTTAHRGS